MRPILKAVLWAIGAFTVGLFVRFAIQGVMGTKLIWLTFYPFMMVAALFGGVASGLLTSTFSIVFAVWGWGLISAKPYVSDFADWFGVGMFFINCALIAIVAEGMRRAQRRSQLEVVDRSGRHLLAIINNVLDMSRIEAGMKDSPEDLMERIRDIVDGSMARALSKYAAN